MAVIKEYKITVLDMSGPERQRKAEQVLDELSAAGWQIHTASLEGGVFMTAVWERDRHDLLPGPQPATGAIAV